MKRQAERLGVVVGVLALGGVAFVASGVNPSTFWPFAAPSPTPDEEPSFQTGNLESVYFNERELADLELADRVDPSNVRYWTGLDRDAFSPGCAAKDCILSIDKPSFVSVAEAESWLGDGHRVISVTDGESARAYPFGILNYHEVVNDQIDGTPIAVTYCPLCRSALVFARPTHGSKLLEFGVAGRLYQDNLILYDRQTGTYWSQLQARPIVGPLVGSGLTLRRRPLDVMKWADWRAQYPDGRVLARPTDGDALGGQESYTRPTVPTGMARGRPSGSSGSFLFDYRTDPYASYAADPSARGGDFDDSRLRPKAEVIGIELNEASAAVPQSRLSPGQSLQLQVAGRTITIRQDEQGRIQASVSKDGQQRELPVVTAYWFAWLSFHPDTLLYEDGS